MTDDGKSTSPSIATAPAVGADDPGAREDAAPLAPEELADRLLPVDPRLSPDGRSVAFVAAPVGRCGLHPERSLWLARQDEPAWPLTAPGADDADPRWSPDGRRLLFTSDRLAPEAERGDERRRLFLLPLGGGEAAPLGELEGELTEPTWSPNGRWAALLRKDPVDPERKRRVEDRDDAVVVDDTPRFTRLWLVDGESGRARCLTHGAYRVWSFAWAPTSEALVVVTTEGAELDAAYGEAHLRSVTIAGGLPRSLAAFPTLPHDPVVVGGDDEAGWRVAVRADEHRADPSESVWLAAAGERRNLLPDYAGVVAALAPIPASPDHVAVRMVEGTHASLYRCSASDGSLAPILGPERHGRGSVPEGPSFSGDGSRLAFVWSDGTTPEEVWLGDVGGEARPVTSFGARFHGRLQPVEVVRWASDDGVEIEGLLTSPAGFEPGRRFPLVVEVHGGPSWQWEDRVMLTWHDWTQLLASRGYAVLAPNPRGSTAYGAGFQRRLQDDVGGGELADLLSGARAMVVRGIADGERLGIGGWSWGGYLTAWAVTQTEVFGAAVMGAGLANFVSDHGQNDIPGMNGLIFPGDPYREPDAYWRASPIRCVTSARTPTLILHGEADARVHPAQGMEFYRALKTLGVPTAFVRYPREEHTIAERRHQIDLMERIVAWFDRWLTKPEAEDARSEGCH